MQIRFLKSAFLINIWKVSNLDFFLYAFKTQSSTRVNFNRYDFMLFNLKNS